ncbi:hypothetical protein [Fodinicola feengrottensis]|uniref:hypothetical protein n=1 Tax=Fodinicola feengrottensis TaxID=435914 RepID=UPI0013D3D867|nr:hypothetical protein [Fodinicola feengrottensis]
MPLTVAHGIVDANAGRPQHWVHARHVVSPRLAVVQPAGDLDQAPAIFRGVAPTPLRIIGM